jgi:hypothetical protein
MGTVDFLVTFLRARLDEDERLAQQGKPIPPDRVLRDIKAKRRIIDELDRRLDDDPIDQRAQWVLHELARPYADHEDYQEE